MTLNKTNVKKYIQDYGNNTSLHGLNYVINPNLHKVEKFIWTVIVLFSFVGAALLILNSLNRYDANPTVISIEKDFRDWNLTFPASTACFLNRLNETSAQDYIYEKWNIDPNSSEGEKIMLFLNTVANLNWENLNDFKNFTKNKLFSNLSGGDLVEISRKVMTQMDYTSDIFNKAYEHIKFRDTILEMGVCFTFNGYVSHLVNFYPSNFSLLNKIDLPVCTYLNTRCYARVGDLPTPVKYYVHSPYDIPTLKNKFFVVGQNMEKDTSFFYSEMVAAEDLSRLEPRQRQCRFVNEPLSGQTFYSYNHCLMSCKENIAVELCGCTPHFYLGSNLCNVSGLACLSEFTDQILNLREADGTRRHCNCLYPCEYTDFYINKESTFEWSHPSPPNIRYRWAVDEFSRARQKRVVIFGFEELLVSLGGTAAFFMGSSVLSFIELLYFCTLRFYWHIYQD